MSWRNISRKKWKTSDWQNQMHLLQPKVPDRRGCRRLAAWSNISSDVLIEVSNKWLYKIIVLFWCLALNFRFLPWSELPGWDSSWLLPDIYNSNIFMWVSSLCLCPCSWSLCLFLIIQCAYNWCIFSSLMHNFILRSSLNRWSLTEWFLNCSFIFK